MSAAGPKKYQMSIWAASEGMGGKPGERNEMITGVAVSESTV